MRNRINAPRRKTPSTMIMFLLRAAPRFAAAELTGRSPTAANAGRAVLMIAPKDIGPTRRVTRPVTNSVPFLTRTEEKSEPKTAIPMIATLTTVITTPVRSAAVTLTQITAYPPLQKQSAVHPILIRSK